MTMLMNFTNYLSSPVYSLGDEEYLLSESEAAGRLVSSQESLYDAGFEKHRICSKNFSTYDLAKNCVEKISADILKTIGAIVFSTALPCNANSGSFQKFEKSGDVKHLMEFPACKLQSEFNLENALVYGLSQQACTGMLGSLKLANMILATDKSVDSVLCITADNFPQGAKYEQAYNLISDGAAAVVASRLTGKFKFLVSHALTNGGLSKVSDEQVAGSFFVYAHKIIQEILDKAGLNLSDIDWIIPQNVSGKAWQIVARLLNFDEQKIYTKSRSKYGHIISSDNMVNLNWLLQENCLGQGQKILLFMTGYGMNWQACILEVC